jgi:serine phosphatase RsbU (regulator of sigma subunit)
VTGIASAQELYWEEPRIMAGEGARFPQTAHSGETAAVLFHRFFTASGEGGQVALSLLVKRGEQDWQRINQVIPQYSYTGEEVPVASVEIDEEGRVLIALARSGRGIEIYRSDPEITSFERIATVGRAGGEEVAVAPRLSRTDTGRFILFVTKPFSLESAQEGDLESLGVTYAVSSDGSDWSQLEPLVTDPDLSYVYLPSHTSYFGREYVAFQATPPESRYYQLYLTYSDDGGRSWSEPVRLTDFQDTLFGTDEPDPDLYDNQRPYLTGYDDTLAVVWERRYAGRGTPQIYYARYDRNGSLAQDHERITEGNYTARNPLLITENGSSYVLWFDDRKGDFRVFIARQEGIAWQEQDVSIMPGESQFARFVTMEEKIYLFWENRVEEESRLVLLEPDRSVTPPEITPLNFTAGTRSALERYRISWNLPRDSSGISGFNWSVDRDPDGRPEEEMNILRQEERRAAAEVDEDGRWYFHVIARDYAGNWSEAATTEFILDRTPPPAVSFEELPKDEEGFLNSNTATIRWNEPDAPDVAGYSYRLQYLAPAQSDQDPQEFELRSTPDRRMTTSPSFSFNNLDNGLWALSVAPIDTVGNKGPANTIYMRLNKYIPVTYITRVGVQQDELNRYQLRLYGRGFSVGGTIEQVMLDRDGSKPYDYVFEQDTGLYSVRTDRIIEGPTIEDIRQGSYRVGVIHPTRGVYFTSDRLEFESTGTVKFGDFRVLDTGPATLVPESKLLFSTGDLSFVLVMLLLVIMAVFAGWRIVILAREGADLRNEIRALIANESLPAETKRKRLREMKRRGIGLHIKFTLLVTFLVLITVLLVSVPLGRFMIGTQRKDLTQGLQESTQVLIESINTGAERFLPEENTIELGRLPLQVRAAEDARFVTITGPPASAAQVEDEDAYTYLWASNDPNIDEKIQWPEGEEPEEGAGDEVRYQRGGVRIRDEITPRVPELRERINTRAQERVGELSDRLSELQQQAREAAQQLVQSQDEDTAQLLRELQDEISSINTRIEERLSEVSGEVRSVPEFQSENVLEGPTRYVFYQPIVYRGEEEGNYYHGMVRLGISTERIIGEIRNSRESLVRQTALIALGAIGLGILGAIVLATIIVRPIRRLVGLVEKIRDTEDKEQLKDDHVSVNTHDELAVLAETIDGMRQGLVKAAVANKELMVGKDVQKMFLPLVEDSSGKRKLTTSVTSTEGADFFGYYEGAKGVSGDYFDYMELDPGRYAVIKCDIAGKGVSASLIMVEVATIFRNYFLNWLEEEERRKQRAAGKGKQRETGDPNLEEVVYSINRLVHERGFQGRFAAFIILLFDANTGNTVMCHAGDNLVHIYDSAKRQMETKTLPQAPTAGSFDNDMVQMVSPFRSVPHMMKRGDALVLFTDGLEEAKRLFRDTDFNLINCDAQDEAQEGVHGNHNLGEEGEEFGLDRVYAITNAVFSRGRFTLRKYHNPVPDEALEFDFTTCSGTIEEVVIALVAVEKVFRIYPDPQAQQVDRVQVDRKIDDFLKQHFRQYGVYFRDPIEVEEYPEYVWFPYLKEDEQFDDLTVLGIYKK